jgi:hypothetical protein
MNILELLILEHVQVT